MILYLECWIAYDLVQFLIDFCNIIKTRQTTIKFRADRYAEIFTRRMFSANTVGNHEGKKKSETAEWLEKILNPSPEEPRIICHVCKSSFNKLADLQRHQTMKNKTNDGTHSRDKLQNALSQCFFSRCSVTESSVDALKLHINTCQFKPKDSEEWTWKIYFSNIHHVGWTN